MTAQVFFVTASATDALYVPASALQNVKSVASANSALNDNTKQKRRRPEGSTVEPVKERTDKKQNSDNNTEQKKDRRAESAQSQAHTATAEVQVLNADGTIETRAVKVGVTNRIQAQIIEGLSEDETIVIPTGSSSTAQRPASGPQGPMPRLN
jgi:macrolide-specific efflux system membrane fusion protein